MGSYEDGQRDAQNGQVDPFRNATDWDYRQGQSAPCFPGSALIATPDGECRMDSLRCGDVVMAWDAAHQTLVARPITKMTAHAPAKILTLLLDDGRTLDATGNHKLLTGRGWSRVDRITTEDTLQAADGAVRRVAAIAKASGKEPVYNIVAKSEHTYVVNGIVAHSFSTLRPVQHLLYRLTERLVDRRAARPARAMARPAPAGSTL